MSNKCEPPSKEVDALAAGEAGAAKIKGYFTMCAPFLIWWYVIPAITSQIFPKETMMVEQATFGPQPDDSIDFTPPEPIMAEVEAPIGWLEYFTKIIFFFSVTCSLTLFFSFLSYSLFKFEITSSLGSRLIVATKPPKPLTMCTTPPPTKSTKPIRWSQPLPHTQDALTG